MNGRLGHLNAFINPTPALFPPVTSGLVFWMDAFDRSTMSFSGNTVTAWTDKSGNEFNFTAHSGSEPTYDATLFSNRGGIVFDYATAVGFLSNSVASTTHLNNFTTIMVGTRGDAILSSGFDDQGNGVSFGPTVYNNRWGGNGNSYYAMQGVPIGIPSVMGFNNTGDPSTAYFFDSKPNKYSMFFHNGGFPTSSNAMGNISLGVSTFLANHGYTMNCAAVLMFNKSLSNLEISQIAGWLTDYYLIPTPTVSPYVINFSGDSITVGFVSDGGTAYPDLAMTALSIKENFWTVSAIVGQTINQTNTTDTTYVDPMYNIALGANKNIVSVSAGVNDLIQGRTAAQLETDIQAYCAARRAIGWKLVVATVLPSSNIADDTQRTTYNTWLRANYASFADQLADIAINPTMGNPANTSNTLYYADGTHPTALGHSLISPYFQTAIGNIL